MGVDLTREFHRIDDEIHRRIDIVGETVTWFEYLEIGAGSTYDDIYDEGPVGGGGRSYTSGVNIPTIYAEEIEDENRAMEEGRQPTQNMRLTIRLTDAEHAGLTAPGEYQPHLKDMFLYDSRYYQVYKYRVRGRMEGQEVLLVVEGVEVYGDQEFPFDNNPAYVVTEPPWPNTPLGPEHYDPEQYPDGYDIGGFDLGFDPGFTF
jgi:hypothetical protein